MSNVINVPYCTICHVVCEDPAKELQFREKHDNTPVSGLELNIKNVYGYSSGYSLFDKSDITCFKAALVEGELYPNSEHNRRYQITTYRIVSDKIEHDKISRPSVDKDEFYTLSEEQFRLFIELVTNKQMPLSVNSSGGGGEDIIKPDELLRGQL